MFDTTSFVCTSSSSNIGKSGKPAKSSSPTTKMSGLGVVVVVVVVDVAMIGGVVVGCAVCV